MSNANIVVKGRNNLGSTTLHPVAGSVNTLFRNTEYAVGDVVYSSELPSSYYLECTVAGTTGESEPDFANTTSE